VTLSRDLLFLLSAAFLRSMGIGLTGVLLALYLAQAGMSAAPSELWSRSDWRARLRLRCWWRWPPIVSAAARC
jgi:hypothetical protein